MARKSTPQKTDHRLTLISREKLLALYAGLIQGRMLEESLADSGRRRLPGREAAAVAVAIDLLAADTLVAPPHDPLPGFIKDKKRGAALATSRKRSGREQPSPAAQLRAAVAAGRRYEREQKQKLVAVFAAEPWTQSAAWHAALQAAGDEGLPMIFVAPRQSGARRKLGFPSIPVDRDDAVALYRVASESIAHARRGNGATLIECIPWELPTVHARSGAGEPGDAIRNIERYLAQEGIPPHRFKARVMANFRRKLRTASA